MDEVFLSTFYNEETEAEKCDVTQLMPGELVSQRRSDIKASGFSKILLSLQ